LSAIHQPCFPDFLRQPQHPNGDPILLEELEMARRNSFDEASVAFRQHLHDLTTPRFTTAAQQTVYEYVKDMQDNQRPPWLYDLTKVWETLLAEPYKGVTSDGNVRDGLYEARDEEFDTKSVIEKIDALYSDLDEDQKEKLSYPINAREWRAWSNPEFLLRPFGIRLEEGTYTPPLISSWNLTFHSS